MKSALDYFNDLYTGDNSLKLLDQKYLPRGIVLLLDVFICFVSLGLVYYVLIDTPLKFPAVMPMPFQVLLVLGTTFIYFLIFKPYSGIIRHSTFADIIKLTISVFLTAATLIFFNYLLEFWTGERVFLTTAIVLYMLLSFVSLLLFRVIVKESYQILKNSATNVIAKKVVIIGINDQSISLGKALITESNSSFRLVGFVDENLKPKKTHKILGKPIITVKNNYSETLSSLDIDGVLLISESFSGKIKNQIVEVCLSNNIEVYNVPLLETWSKKEDIKNKIKPIEIEDLLDRKPIIIDKELLELDLKNKTILVTGGAGSIGSEIVKQVSGFNPKLLVILDQAESGLHELEMFLNLNFPNLNFVIELANVSKMRRMTILFSKYKFDIIYHAAAYKHVPLMEESPYEAVKINIGGTKNIANLSLEFGVERFVMVSTDKAVNPTNVMGATKRVAEMYIGCLNEKSKTTKFTITRFGNVLGSNGSVIPLFKKQIEKGGPLTVTHKDITRYFMTIPEACCLVLEAGTMGDGGEIYIFDMGKSVKIFDVAKKMIHLSGLKYPEDIDIKITGLLSLIHISEPTRPY